MTMQNKASFILFLWREVKHWEKRSFCQRVPFFAFYIPKICFVLFQNIVYLLAFYPRAKVKFTSSLFFLLSRQRPDRNGVEYGEKFRLYIPTWYRVIQGFIWYFQNLLGFQGRQKLYHRKQRQGAMSEQVFMIFGHGQNHHNQTFTRPYKPNES